MKIRKMYALLTITLLSSTIAFAQGKVKQIDNLLKKYQEYGQFNGTVLVAEKGKVIYKKGHGMANMEWDIPNTADTKFRIGSVTKQFTAALILQLVDEGKIKLDGKLTDYLPDYRKDTGNKITVHQLLNHTSGVPNYTTGEFFRKESRTPYGVDEFVKKFASEDLDFEPGTNWNYSNSAYFLLGAIIEKVDGKSYAESLRARILDPIGMKDTGYDTHSPILKKRARGYQRTPDGYINAGYLDMGLPYAAGSMYSTVEDLYKWDQALYGSNVVSDKSKKLMFTPGKQDYGYGFFIEDQNIGKTNRKVKTINHGGGINGFNCLFTRVVDQKHLVVVLDNVTQGNYHGRITSSIISILNDSPAEMPKKSIAEALYKTAMKDGGKEAVAKYRKLKSLNYDKYSFAEVELNTLGYQLLNRGKTRDAIEIFKLNVEMFPKSSNPYDSLGEAYLKHENKELALKNYKKAVEIDPKNSNAIQIINKLKGQKTKVDEAVLKTYVGDYEIAPNFILTITFEDGKLVGQATGQQKLELQPETNTQFVVPSVRANITFEKDSKGAVTNLILNQSGQLIKAKKIK